MAKQRYISHKDGSVISSGQKSTTKKRKGKGGKNPPKKGSDAKKKSRTLRNSLTSSPLNSGLDSTGKPHIKKPPDRKSQEKPVTNESETNVSTKIINTLPKIFRYCSYDACKMITPRKAKYIKKCSTYGCGKFVHRACQEQHLKINNFEEDDTVPGCSCHGCLTSWAKELTSTQKSGTNKSKNNDVDKLNVNSIEENKKNEEDLRVVATVTVLDKVQKVIDEAARLDKIAELEASQKANLDKKTASTKMIEELNRIAGLEPSKQDDLKKKIAPSTDENNLPKGKPSLSLIAAGAAKKNEKNHLSDSETTHSDDPDSPQKKKPGVEIDMSPMTLEEIIELRKFEKEFREERREIRRIEDIDIQYYDNQFETLYSQYSIEIVTVRDFLGGTCFKDGVFSANISTVFSAKYKTLDGNHKKKYNNDNLDKVIITKAAAGTVVIKTTLRYPNDPLLKFTQTVSAGVLSTKIFKDITNNDLVFTALHHIVIPSDRVSILQMSRKKILDSSTTFKFRPYQYDICFVSNLHKDHNVQIANVLFQHFDSIFQNETEHIKNAYEGWFD